MGKPRRRFKVDLKLETDDLNALRHAMRSIEFEIATGSRSSVSGGVDSSWVFTVVENPDMTPEKYQEALKDYLNEDKGRTAESISSKR